MAGSQRVALPAQQGGWLTPQMWTVGTAQA